MQMSKREFSKLSIKDQERFMKPGSSKNKQQKRKPNKGNNARVSSNNQRRENAPVAMSRKLKEYRPVEAHRANGSRCIRFKEYVQDIPGSVAFAATQFQCNPGLSNLFAWLSGQALFYQEYKVKSLRFRFETEKATTLSGKVMFAFLQDSSDPIPVNKQEMLENLMKAAGAIWEPFTLPITMSSFPALGKSRFIRGGTLGPNLDVKTYDIGQLIVATQGMADTTLVGELYIEYDIELITPIQSIAQIFGTFSKHIVGNVALTAADPFGTSPTLSGTLGVTMDATSTMTFQQTGQFLMEFDVTGTGLFTVFNPTLTPVGLTANIVGVAISNAAANAGTQASWTLLVGVSARGQTLQIVYTGDATTVTGNEVRIAPYPGNLG